MTLPEDLVRRVVAIPLLAKEECAICGARGGVASAESTPAAVGITVTVLFKTIEKRACVPCATELRDLLDMRIAQAKRGEFTR